MLGKEKTRNKTKQKKPNNQNKRNPTIKTTVHSLFFIFPSTPHFYAHVALYGLVQTYSET